MAVARQDLFDQGGAGAGQAQDEYRRRVRVAEADRRVWVSLIEDVDNLVVHHLGLHRVVVFEHALFGVAA